MVAIHQGQPVLGTGAALEYAKGALVMIHGRGASAADILSLTQELDITGIACRAPQAAGGTWYPYRFMEPVQKNEPHLSSALATIHGLMETLREAGLPPEKVILLGFSQGACLASEYVARNPKRYGGLIVFSGGLIGNGDTLRTYEGSLEQTPVFIGCSDQDAHIPLERVKASAEILRGMGAAVEERIYPNMGHTINTDELQYAQQMLDAVKA